MIEKETNLFKITEQNYHLFIANICKYPKYIGEKIHVPSGKNVDYLPAFEKARRSNCMMNIIIKTQLPKHD